MSLTRVSGNVYVLEGRTNIGVITTEGRECLVVDTGVSRDHGRKLFNILKDMGLKIRAVINTHSHADHIGGNKIILERSNVVFYSSVLEKPFIELPLTEVIYLYGAYPPEILRKHLIEAEGVPVDDVSKLIKEYFLRIEELPGHSIGMIGVGIGNVLFSADAFFPDEVIRKYVVPYHFNVQEALKTLEKLNVDILKNYEVVVPSHGKILKSEEAQQLVSNNIKTIINIKNVISRNADGVLSLNELIKRVFKDLALVPQTTINYLLIVSALKSYIAWLVNEDFIELTISDNELYVRKVKT
ncbi:MAG: MBL fold metallo-hydrolase [Desulfurococcaceae archaeon TW002]